MLLCKSKYFLKLYYKLKKTIIENLDVPQALEKLYRANKVAFKKEFNAIYPTIQHHAVAQVWHERLNFGSEETDRTTRELVFVLIASLVAGVIAKIPALAGLDVEYFYSRHVAFIVFPLLMIYFAWKQKIPLKEQVVAAIAVLLAAVFINLLPNNPQSNTLILACIHLPLFLWATLGFVFVGNNLKNHQKRLDFLRYNGDLVVMTTLILVAGGLLTVITLGLFSIIGLDIKNFYAEYVVVGGLAAAPIVGTYLVQTNPQLVNQVSPVIANIFTPLVLIMLVIYLSAVVYTGKDPYNDREFLLIFNLLLIGVMAIIFFSLTETSKNADRKIGLVMVFGIAVLTIIVNGIALSAIVFRISEGGLTPNRLAVLGSNALILTHLLVVTYRLYQTLKNDDSIEEVENGIASFLPIYGAWAMLVTFLFPVFFNFK